MQRPYSARRVGRIGADIASHPLFEPDLAADAAAVLKAPSSEDEPSKLLAAVEEQSRILLDLLGGSEEDVPSGMEDLLKVRSN